MPCKSERAHTLYYYKKLLRNVFPVSGWIERERKKTEGERERERELAFLINNSPRKKRDRGLVSENP